jgi:hypothetical protein
MNNATLGSFGLAACLLAGMHCAPVHAQEQSNSPTPTGAAGDSAAAQTVTPAPNPASTKKVWTNEDIGDLHRNSVISTFSGPAHAPSKTNEKANTAAKNKDAKPYQDQIAGLRAKLPPLDAKIAQLQDALNGNTVQETRTYGGNRIDDWHEELLKFQKQREDIEAKISVLQDEARHRGVPENQIPQ